MEKKVVWLIAAAILVQLAGAWCIDVMDVDSAQYASISLEMLKSHSFLQVHDFGRDYLDKPPLLFWVSSLSFWVLGISQFTFRVFPVLISVGVGATACYRFCKLYYTRQTGYLAALFYLTSQTVFLMAFDLRTDSLLTAAVIMAIAEFAWYLEKKTWIHLLAGSVALGLAMLAKGPIGLIVVIFALGAQVLMTRNWKMLFNWHWLVSFLIVCLILIPMSIGLYQQFDQHPEKLVNGLHHVSGLRFYYWGQSFGRVTGESPWKNDTDKLFLIHSYLWSSLPWSLLTLFALFYKIRNFSRSKEYMTTGAFLLTITALSFSAYKLPHYINVIIPLGSILSAWFVTEVYSRPAERIIRLTIRIIQGILLTGLWSIAGLLAWFVFPLTRADLFLLILIPALAAAIYYWVNRKGATVLRLVLPSAITIIAVNLFMNVFFYPNLLNYQAPSVLAKFVVAAKIPVNRFFVYEDGPPGSMDFYAGQIVQSINLMQLKTERQPVWLYIPKSKLPQLLQAVHSFTLVREVPAYPVTRLNIKFLNPRLRPAAVELIDLVRIN